MDRINHQWRLQSRPVVTLGRENFTWTEEPATSPQPGEILVRTIYISVDPTNRLWATEAEGYLPPVALGDVMRGGTIGIVEESTVEAFAPGDLVQGMWGWQEYGIARPPAGISRIPRVDAVPLSAWTSVLGVTGLTAYVGLFDIGRPKAGETVVISAAAGAVGSIAGQLAKIHGCRVVGIAGGADKCAWLVDSLGFDAAIDYKHDDVRAGLRKQCPAGIDVLFENVGGDIFEAAFAQMNVFGRVALCGLISTYNTPAPALDPMLLHTMLMKRLDVRGFIILDHAKRFGQAVTDMLGWLAEGRLQYRVDIVEGGIDATPDALAKLFDGSNTGKLIVKVSEPPPGAPDATGTAARAGNIS